MSRDRQNFLDETLEVLANHDLSPKDIIWVGSRDGKYSISWDEFAAIANKDYDSGYGGNEVIDDLVVVGVGWWLERHEYDGSEWWEYKIIPWNTKASLKFTKVFKEDYESSLEELNPEKGQE